jgi:hypothetical protein
MLIIINSPYQQSFLRCLFKSLGCWSHLSLQWWQKSGVNKEKNYHSKLKISLITILYIKYGGINAAKILNMNEKTK